MKIVQVSTWIRENTTTLVVLTDDGRLFGYIPPTGEMTEDGLVRGKWCLIPPPNESNIVIPVEAK